MKLITIAMTLLVSTGLVACAGATNTGQIPTTGQMPTTIAVPETPEQGPTAQEARVLGILTFQTEDTSDVIKAPETVQAGEDFEITITTFGGGCDRAGDSGVLLTKNSATVMIYDFTSATHPDVICTQVLKRLTHTVTLRF